MPSFPPPSSAVARPPPSSAAGVGAPGPASSSSVVPPSASMATTGGPIPSTASAIQRQRQQVGGGVGGVMVHQQRGRQRKNNHQKLPVRGNSNFVTSSNSTSTLSSSVRSSTPAQPPPSSSSSSSSPPTLVPQPVGYDSKFDPDSASAYAVPPGYLGGDNGIGGAVGVGGDGGGIGQQQRPIGNNGRFNAGAVAGLPTGLGARSNGEDSVVVVDATSTMMKSASRLTVSSCRCPHLDAIFPRLLSSAGMGRGRLGSGSGSGSEIDIGGTLALHGMHLSTVPVGGNSDDGAGDGADCHSSDRWLYDEEARAVSLACGTDVGSYLPLPPQPVPRLPSGGDDGDGATVSGGGGSSSSTSAGGIHPPPLAGGGGAGGPVSSPSTASVRPPFSPGTPTKQPRPSVTSTVGEGRARTPPPSPPFVACCEDEEETEKEKSDPKRDGGDDRGGEGCGGGASGGDEEEKFLLPEERYHRLRLAESTIEGEVGRVRGDRTKGGDDDGDGARSGAPQPAIPSLASLAASFASKKKTGGGLPPPIPSSSSAAAAAAASDPTGRTGGVSKRPRLGTGRDDENHHRAGGDGAPAAAFAAEEAVTVATMASVRGEEYLERVRGSRESYWTWWRTSSSSDTEEGEKREEGEDRHRRHTWRRDVHLRCGWCDDGEGERRAPSSRFPADGDEIMQCLDCGVIGCGPRSTSSSVRSGRNKRVFKRGGRQHLIRHFVATGHSLGITCGPRADVFCMRCGDFVYHELFDREILRAEVSNRVPWLGWGRDVGPLRRSFGPSEFLVVDSSSSSSLITTNPGGATPSTTASATVKKGGKLVPSNGGIDSATVIWPGMVATYPMPHLSPALVVGGLHSLRRLRIFGGELDGSLAWGPEALRLGIYQLRRGGPHRWKIRTPVGMYNLGNTCFMSCVLQCLLHCEPLQSHFLRDVGHHHVTCEILRAAHRRSLVDRRAADDVSFSPPSEGGGPSSMQHALVHPSSPKCPASWGEYCLACEMDRLFLETYGSSVGIDAVQSVSELPSSSSPSPIAGVPSLDRNAGSSDGATSNSRVGKAEARSEHSLAPGVRGTPLVPSRLLTAAWRCGGMDHLAGYEQRDAHEFLQGFLDIMAKHDGQNRRTAARLRRLDDVAAAAKNEGRRGEGGGGAVGDDDAEDDVVTSLFQGQLRSVLICEKCGCKRSQPEPFLNISLPISKERGDGSKVKIPSTMIGTRQSTLKAARMNLQMCLEQFTTPEALADPVHCHWCNEKTPTQKQLTFAKLPRVLCLHLKRFDARTNKKISDPVTFPVRGLDMGRHLPYWCEVVKGVQSMGEEKKDDKPSQAAPSPHVLYDLFGIINHTGSLHQGHYLAHVKVQEKWYHCNDAFVSDSGGLSEKETDGAYMLFYIRREK